MAKGHDAKKTLKKQAVKTLKEKRNEKRGKKTDVVTPPSSS